MLVEMLIASQLGLSINTLSWMPLEHMIQLVDNAFTLLNVNALSNYLIAVSVKFMSTVHTDIRRYEIPLTNRVRGLESQLRTESFSPSVYGPRVK